LPGLGLRRVHFALQDGGIPPFVLGPEEDAEGDAGLHRGAEGVLPEVLLDHVDGRGVRVGGLALLLQQVAEAERRVEHQGRSHPFDHGVFAVIVSDDPENVDVDVLFAAGQVYGYFVFHAVLLIFPVPLSGPLKSLC